MSFFFVDMDKPDIIEIAERIGTTVAKKGKILPANEVLRTSTVKGRAGYYLLQQMAVYSKIRGYKLDVSEMALDDCYFHEGSVSTDIEAYTMDLLEEGCLTGYAQRYPESDSVPYSDDLVVDIDIFKDKHPIWLEEDENLYWSYTWSKCSYNQYLTNKLKKYETIEYFIIMIIAKYLVDYYLGEVEKNLLLDMSEFTNSMMMYMSIIKIEDDLKEEWDELPFRIVWDEDIIAERKFDVKYKLFFDECIESGKAGVYTAPEKEKQMQEMGMKEGAILVLYTRGRLSQYRSWGDIVSANVVKYKGIVKDRVILDTICVTRTKEEIYEQLMALPLDKRQLCQDAYTEDAKVYEVSIPIYNLGIEGYLCCKPWQGELEPYILAKIDKTTETKLYTRINGKLGDYTMKELDAVFWLLKQNHIPFDEGLYKKMYYKHGNRPLWEKVGATDGLGCFI